MGATQRGCPRQKVFEGLGASAQPVPCYTHAAPGSVTAGDTFLAHWQQERATRHCKLLWGIFSLQGHPKPILPSETVRVMGGSFRVVLTAPQ
jgi:hypothetical protein